MSVSLIKRPARRAPLMRGNATRVQRMALLIKKRIDIETREWLAAYEQECARDAANGHRAHYCLHGMNRWTDYDNICGWCEDGYTSAADYARLNYSRALNSARQYVKGADAMVAYVAAMGSIGITVRIPDADVDALLSRCHMGPSAS